MSTTASENDSLKLAIFASGSGSNMQAIVDAAESGSIQIEVALVVSNKPTPGCSTEPKGIAFRPS